MKTKPSIRKMHDAAQIKAARRLVERCMRFCRDLPTLRNQPPQRRERNPETVKSKAFESALAAIAMNHEEMIALLKAMERRSRHRSLVLAHHSWTARACRPGSGA